MHRYHSFVSIYYNIYDDAAAIIFIMGRVIISMMGGSITTIILTASMYCYHRIGPAVFSTAAQALHHLYRKNMTVCDMDMVRSVGDTAILFVIPRVLSMYL